LTDSKGWGLHTGGFEKLISFQKPSADSQISKVALARSVCNLNASLDGIRMSQLTSDLPDWGLPLFEI
jgi:hypothetical protein